MPAQPRTTIKKGAITRALLKKKARNQKRKETEQSSRDEQRELTVANETRIQDLENELAELRKEKEADDEYYLSQMNDFEKKAEKSEKKASAMSVELEGWLGHMIDSLNTHLCVTTGFLTNGKRGMGMGLEKVEGMKDEYKKLLWAQLLKLGETMDEAVTELRNSSPSHHSNYMDYVYGEGMEINWETGSVKFPDTAGDEEKKDDDDNEKVDTDDEAEDSGTEKEEESEDEDNSDVDLEAEEEGQTNIHEYLLPIDEASEDSDDSNCYPPPKKVKRDTKKSKKH